MSRKRGLLSKKKIKPEYNICKEPGAPMSGRTHSDETKILMSEAKKGNTNGFKKGQSKPEGSGTPSQSIEVFDLEEKTNISYNSIREAARTCLRPNIHHTSIVRYFAKNQQKPYKGRYTFKRVLN
jgi:hypothetical protein